MVKTPAVSLQALSKAVNALNAAITDAKSGKYPEDYMRDAVIQRFEFTFELTWKTLQRFFNLNQRPAINNIRDIFREAGKLQFIDSVELWFEFHEARNLTSHTYDEAVSARVFESACLFLPEATLLLGRLQNAIK